MEEGEAAALMAFSSIVRAEALSTRAMSERRELGGGGMDGTVEEVGPISRYGSVVG